MTASLLIPPKARFFNASGEPLAGGFVYSYAAGTLTPKDTYTTYQGNVANTNPVVLDAAGEANIWLDGNYKIALEDADHVSLWTVDNITSITAGSNFYTTTGTANNYILTPSPAISSYTEGLTYFVVFNVANSGPSTINVSGLGAKSLVIAPATALSSGNLLTSIVYQIVYDGTNFQVLNPTTVATVAPYLLQIGLTATAPSGYVTLLNTNTLGSATSGATYAGSQYQSLYVYLWDNILDAYAPVSGGRGVSGAADFAANKPMTLPDTAGRTAVGVGAIFTSAMMTAGANTVTSTGTISTTVDNTTLTTGQIPSHGHPYRLAGGEGTGGMSIGNITPTNYAAFNGTPSGTDSEYIGGTGGGGAHNHTASSSYTGNATSVVQPGFGVYWYINY